MSTSYNTRKSVPPLRLALAAAVAVCLSAPVFAHEMAHDTKHASDTKTTMEATGSGRATDSKSQAAERRFLDAAIDVSEREVAAANLAKAKASDSRVRDIADKLGRDNAGLLNKLEGNAVALGLGPSRSYDMASTMNGDSEGVRDDITRNTAMGGTSTSGTTATSTGTVGGVDESVDESVDSMMGSEADSHTAMADVYGDEETLAGTTMHGAPMASQDMANDPEIRSLAAKSGADFDRAFLDQVISNHERSIANYTRASSDMALSSQTRTLASQSLPSLRSHLEMARMLRQDVGKTVTQ